MISARDLREFRGFLRNATDRQVQGIYDKESSAGRDEYAELAVAEAERRGIHLEQPDHARKKRGHATKKSHAQLDREIAQVLERKSGPSRTGASPGRHHSSISDSDKIRDAIARFPSTFGLRGFPGNMFRISPTSSYVSGGRVMLYTERKDDGGWSDFSKGTESELRSEITSLSSTRK